ncbi:MAG: response regulator, partial [Clostridia bacterium]|nr:response regulator [Clostridia bacterium]
MRVLLVEDDFNLALAVEYALKSEGYSVVKAASKKEALMLFDGSIEMVLLDVMLPDGSGYEILS